MHLLLQVILESVTKLVHMIAKNASGPEMTWAPIGLLIGDLITKTTLFFGRLLSFELAIWNTRILYILVTLLTRALSLHDPLFHYN